MKPQFPKKLRKTTNNPNKGEQKYYCQNTKLSGHCKIVQSTDAHNHKIIIIKSFL